MFDIQQLFANFLQAPAPLAYNKWVRVYEDMSVHTQGKSPVRIIDTRRPYEDMAIRDYRLESYEPITKEAINRAIQNLQRLFSSANIRIKTDEIVAEYVSENDFNDKDFIGFIASEVTRRMIEDPNGCLVWMPTGEGLVNPAVSVEVNPVLVLSESIKHADNNALVWLTNERSDVFVGSKLKQEGNVYAAATVSGFYRFEQFGKKSESRYRIVSIYEQEFTYAPYIILGGELTQEINDNKDRIEYYESYFSTYLPFANEAIRQFSDHQGIMVTSAFPMRVMEPIECNADGCRDGIIYDHKDPSIKHTCGNCKGTGFIAPPSPYGTILRPKASGVASEAITTPVLEYVSPDVGIVKYSGEHWESLLKKAEKALHLIFIDEAQSGIAKSIDREDKETSIDRIGANVYNNIVKNSLIIIGDLLTLGQAQPPIIYLPPTFRVKSESEMIQELNELRKDGAPDFVITEATKELMQRRYGANPAMIKVVDILSEEDSFFALSTKEKNELLAQGAMSERDYLFSLHAPRALMRLAKDEDFIQKSHQEITQELNSVLLPIINSRPTSGALAD